MAGEIAFRCEPASGPSKTALERECPVLASISPDWQQITQLYRHATAFMPMEAILSNGLNLPRADESAWQTRIYDILHGLQTFHEPGEAELRQEGGRLPADH